jgi:hypothetical protein
LSGELDIHKATDIVRESARILKVLGDVEGKSSDFGNDPTTIPHHHHSEIDLVLERSEINKVDYPHTLAELDEFEESCHLHDSLDDNPGEVL